METHRATDSPLPHAKATRLKMMPRAVLQAVPGTWGHLMVQVVAAGPASRVELVVSAVRAYPAVRAR